VSICFLITLVTLGAVDSISEFAGLSEQAAASLEHTPLLLDVPDLSLDDALAAVQADPESATDYLALAKAHWQDNDTSRARNAVRQGFAYADDPVAYAVTAANFADLADEAGDASAYLLIAVNLADGTDSSTTVYNLASQYLYDLALEGYDFDIAQTIRSIVSELALRNIDADSALVRITLARKRLTDGQVRLAGVVLGGLDAADQDLAEYHLVHGDYFLAQGKNEAAIDEWEAAIDAAGAPAWVKDRATELIQSTEE